MTLMEEETEAEKGRAELGAPDSKACAYHRQREPLDPAHSTHPGRALEQLLPGLAPSAGGHKVRRGWEHRPVPHTFHNPTDGAMEQEG